MHFNKFSQFVKFNFTAAVILTLVLKAKSANVNSRKNNRIHGNRLST